MITSKITIGLTAYLQGKLVDPLHPRIAGIANIDFKILEHLKLSISYDWFYDMQPIAPIPNFYFTLNNKISLNF